METEVRKTLIWFAIQFDNSRKILLLIQVIMGKWLFTKDIYKIS
jgi:hypothetical protein